MDIRDGSGHPSFRIYGISYRLGTARMPGLLRKIKDAYGSDRKIWIEGTLPCSGILQVCYDK